MLMSMWTRKPSIGRNCSLNVIAAMRHVGCPIPMVGNIFYTLHERTDLSDGLKRKLMGENAAKLFNL
jgi:hypothetical protein